MSTPKTTCCARGSILHKQSRGTRGSGLHIPGWPETYYYEGVYGFAASISDNREKALAPALRAVVLDAKDAGAHCTLGPAY